ncbi:4-hydroxy-3-methylbut-2-enyl diphosphate reductase [Thermophagus xiamenensis]|jgi:4-hydroxy-3-methylbut-2-enyl diphosphate reductase|uniref:4-hydroxy-3-methylbut-2-enyl diphosphate reductase n=2 Tax=Thermophagus xiamenensis TaxID=385682 RepID=A0A1I2CH64_9BACT|nr:4-hydroxy-3-methylbut-2-enyl diphosphate reductase [Thermophagus xiamenensis]
MNFFAGREKSRPMHVEIDDKSGFCFGVIRAITKAEEELGSGRPIYSLGDIVHNDREVARLNSMGLAGIGHNTFNELQEGTVLFRAHGEPPESYATIRKNQLKLIDATCPVVLQLQKKVKRAWEEMKEKGGQVAIYGKKGHAEVRGLAGQTDYEAIIIESEEDIKRVDAERPVVLFSQTTKSPAGFKKIAEALIQQARKGVEVRIHDTICRQVSNRAPHLQKFASRHEVVIFVGGTKSSNAKSLYQACVAVNPKTYFITGPEELQAAWFDIYPASVGVCGATSTPQWLMEKVAEKIRSF